MSGCRYSNSLIPSIHSVVKKMSCPGLLLHWQSAYFQFTHINARLLYCWHLIACAVKKHCPIFSVSVVLLNSISGKTVKKKQARHNDNNDTICRNLALNYYSNKHATDIHQGKWYKNSIVEHLGSETTRSVSNNFIKKCKECIIQAIVHNFKWWTLLQLQD